MSTRRMAAAVLLIAATVARAEVRLVRGPQGPELAVRPTPQGVWTPLGSPDAATLNPGGDLLGDGYPGQSTARGKLLAAWQRPTSAGLILLSASATSSFTAVELATDPGAGTPVVTAAGDAWLVAWQAGLTDPEVMAVLATDGEIGDPSPIVPGELVGAYWVGDTLHLATVQRAAKTLTIATFLSLHEPNPIPVPTMLTLVSLSWVPNPIPIPTTHASRLHLPDPIPVTSRSAATFVSASWGWMPCVEERDDDVLIAWQAGHGQVGRVLLTEFGVDGEGDLVRGPNGSCQAILNAAARN